MSFKAWENLLISLILYKKKCAWRMQFKGRNNLSWGVDLPPIPKNVIIWTVPIKSLPEIMDQSDQRGGSRDHMYIFCCSWSWSDSDCLPSQGSKGIRQCPINRWNPQCWYIKIYLLKITITGWNIWAFNLMNQRIKIK